MQYRSLLLGIALVAGCDHKNAKDDQVDLPKQPSPDPTPANQQYLLQQEQSDLRLGVRTINEVRASRGLAPVAWGDKPL